MRDQGPALAPESRLSTIGSRRAVLQRAMGRFKLRVELVGDHVEPLTIVTPVLSRFDDRRRKSRGNFVQPKALRAIDFDDASFCVNRASRKGRACALRHHRQQDTQNG